MKVRWMANSLRLRITPSELTRLQAGHPVEEGLCLPGIFAPVWRVVVMLGEASGINAEQGQVRVTLGREDTLRLIVPENEGVYFPSETPDGFRYYIEKDFPCLHPRAMEALEATETFAPPPDFHLRK